MKLAVVIVNYNVRYYLAQCLDSVLKAIGGLEVEVYVVDNHSKDDSVKYIKANYPQVNFISSLHNVGFSRANNIAIRQSTAEYVLLLNPDTIVAEKTLGECVAFMDAHPDAGALGVQMLNSDGSRAPESRRGVPTPMTSLYKILGLCGRYPQHPKYARYYMSGISWDEPGQIDICSGACVMFRRSVLDKVGLLDEDYFMYGEDIDLCYRVLQNGWKNYYVPSKIMHYKGESTQHSSFRYVHVFYQAMLIFYRKNFSHAFWVSIPIRMAIYMKAFMSLFTIQVNKLKKMIGFMDPYHPQIERYIFVCMPSSQQEIRKIARSYGLEAIFVDAVKVAVDNSHKHVLDEYGTELSTCIVYDTSVFDYSKIMNLFAQNPNRNVLMGFYYPQRRTIVTPLDVYDNE